MNDIETGGTVCDLVLEACHLVELAAGGRGGEDLLAEAAHLREHLCAAVAACQDPAVEADGRAAIANLDALVRPAPDRDVRRAA